MPDYIEVVVVARILSSGLNAGSLSGFVEGWLNLPPGERDPEWAYGPYAQALEDRTSPNDPKRVVIDSVIDNYLESYGKLKTWIQFLDPTARVKIGLGFTISVADLQAKINSLRCVVTGMTYQPGAAGRNFGDRFEINYKSLQGYELYGDEGINYLILHEIAHNTLTGVASRQWQISQWQQEWNNGSTTQLYQGTEPHFVQQEAYANSIARLMAQSIGVSITPPGSDPLNWPPNGYALDVEPQ